MLIRTGRRGVAALALALAPGLPACAGGEGTTAEQERPRRYVVITHGQSADPFWSVVANGARDAARDLGARVEYQAPTSFDMVEMANLMQAAVASRPDGLIVSLPDADALAGPVRSAVEAGVPVVTINAGADASPRLGALLHVGQSEYDAGYAAGRRLAASGARGVLCVNHEVGNASLDLRCGGAADALREGGGALRVLAVDLSDPGDAQHRIAGALGADRSLDAVLALGPAGARPMLAAARPLARELRLATFDLTPEVLEAVRDGHILFAVDQQQYLQGYLPVVVLTAYHRTGAVPGGGAVLATGPGFVTAETAADVIERSARGLR